MKFKKSQRYIIEGNKNVWINTAQEFTTNLDHSIYVLDIKKTNPYDHKNEELV